MGNSIEPNIVRNNKKFSLSLANHSDAFKVNCLNYDSSDLMMDYDSVSSHWGKRDVLNLLTFHDK